MLVQTRQQFEAVRTALIAADVIVLDTETTGLEPHYGDRLCGVATKCDVTGTEFTLEAYFPFRHKPGESLFDVSENIPEAWLRELAVAIRDSGATLIYHNAKFDKSMLYYEGIVLPNKYEDTLIMSWLNNENESHRLKDLAEKYLDSNAKKEEELIKKHVKREGSYENVPPALMEPYACKDVHLTAALFEFLSQKLTEQNLMQLREKKYRLNDLLLDIEIRGIGVDCQMAKRLSDEAVARMREIEDELGFDPQKGDRLAHKLFASPPEGLGLLPAELTSRTSSEFPCGIPAMREEFLSRHLDQPVVASVLEYRGLVKANSTWFAGFQKKAAGDGRIHTTFNSLSSSGSAKGKSGTKTGRLNSSNPNVQQIPRVDEVEDITKNVKQLFRTGKDRWHLYEFDYSQVEARIGAVYGNAEPMLDAFRAREDAHKVTAERIGCSRQTAKHATYTTLYGGGAATLAATIERLEFQTTGRVVHYPVEDAQSILDAFFGLYPGLKAISQTTSKLMRTRGYVQIWNGQRRHYDFWYKEGHKKDNAHAAFNSICQGGAAGIIEQSMLMLADNPKPYAYNLVSQVHDSLWIEVISDFREEYIEEIKYTMEWPGRDPKWKIPFDVDVKLIR